MLRSAKIVHTEIMVLNRDLFPVTRFLARTGAAEIIPVDNPDTGWNAAELDSLLQLQRTLTETAESLALAEVADADGEAPIAMEQARELNDRIEQRLFPLLQNGKQLEDRIRTLEKSREEFDAFRDFQFDFSKINSVSFLFFKYGSVPASRFDELTAAVGDKALLIPVRQAAAARQDVQKRTTLLAASSKKGRFALETALASCAFQEAQLPPGLQGVPAEIISTLDAELAATREALRQTGAEKDRLAAEYGEPLAALRGAVRARIRLLETARSFSHTQYTSTIRCWIPAAVLPAIRKELDALTDGKAALAETNPRSLPAEFLAAHPVPVLLKNRTLFKPFEFLISNYGYPEYGEIEPTPIVGLGFLAMFGIMFGDVGQGAVLFVTGLVMTLLRRLKPALRQAGLLVAMAGLSGSFFGLVYGSVFCNPHLIKPLWKEPLANPDDILVLFGATIAFGVLWINVGLLLNMINRIRARDWRGVFLEKTGLPGIIFYWGALVLLAGGGLLGLRITPPLVLLLTGVPLLVLFLREPLYGLFTRTALFPHGVFSFIMEGVVELIDTLSYFMGNTVSFVRVGAFALAHSGLSLAFMKLYELVGGGAGGIAVLVFGNLLIIVLEGMVVSIQTMRLEYYEFFSKFYSGSGHPFTPFRLAAGKGA